MNLPSISPKNHRLASLKSEETYPQVTDSEVGKFVIDHFQFVIDFAHNPALDVEETQTHTLDFVERITQTTTKHSKAGKTLAHVATAPLLLINNRKSKN